MDHFIPAILQHSDFGGGADKPRVSHANAFNQHVRSLRNDVDLLQEEFVELVVARQQIHRFVEYAKSAGELYRNRFVIIRQRSITSYARGNTSVKTDPLPVWLVTATEPPSRSVIFLTIDKPK